MRFFSLFTLIFTIQSSQEEILTDEERNLRCCAQNAECCKIFPTDFEVRSLLQKCHKPEANSEKKKMPMTVVRTVRSANQEDFDRTRKDKKAGISNCKRKLKLSVRIKNNGLTNCKSQYILIDHVFDTITQQRQKLFNPYVLKIVQRPVLAVYGLTYDGIVNAQAKEVVANKDQPGYSGCDPDNATNRVCGTVSYKSKAIPYSNGFCCSCDKTKESPFRKMSQIPASYQFRKDSKNNWEESNQSKARMHTNESQPNKIHKRGGQDCSNKYTPSNIIDPQAYHSSSHCLQFSEVWYFIYKLQKPQIHHTVSLQLFEKYQSLDGTCKWRDLTKKVPVIVGTDRENYINDDLTLSMNYSKREIGENMLLLNHQLHKLLVPDVANVVNKNFHPEILGGPSEYLVVKGTQIQPNGKTCNVAGVGYEAFVNQPNRCSMPRGSCLKNQPIHMWQQDHEMETLGKRGNYFLKYFGLLPDNPVVFDENKTLTFYVTNTYTSFLEVEVKADDNPLLRANTLATITEVYIESTTSQKTSIITKVFNSGLVASVFYLSLTECPLSLPASFSHINSKPALIPPQQQHIFNLEIQCPLTLSSFVCSLQVLNMKQELIAIRKIRIEQADRCICMWYCSCACYSSDYGLKCRPLPLEAYHIAGFQGGEPIPLQVVEYTFWDDIISVILYIFLTVCLTLLVMGLVKGLSGLCVVPIGLWGLDIVLDLPKKIGKYHEKDISHRTVIYDLNGWPVHPDTMERVRNIPVPAEFCVNLVFFIVYPFSIIWYFLKKACSNKVSSKDSKDIDVCYCKQGTSVQRKNIGLQNTLVKRSKDVYES